MKSHSLRKLSIPLIILGGFLYLAFNSGTKAQDNEETKGRVKSQFVTSIMKFNPFSGADSTERNGSSIEPDAATIGANVNVSNQAGPQSETDIAIDPTNPNHLVGGSNDISSGKMRVYESFDGGKTWANQAMPDAPAPFNKFYSDPAVTFDSKGNAFYSYLGINASIFGVSGTTLVSAKKPANSTSWQAPVVVPNVNADKNLMT